jgi:hypothetical protein
MADEITPIEEIQNQSTEEEQQYHQSVSNVESTHDSSTSEIDHLCISHHIHAVGFILFNMIITV